MLAATAWGMASDHASEPLLCRLRGDEHGLANGPPGFSTGPVQGDQPLSGAESTSPGQVQVAARFEVVAPFVCRQGVLCS